MDDYLARNATNHVKDSDYLDSPFPLIGLILSGW
jgi:hypothetical protein